MKCHICKKELKNYNEWYFNKFNEYIGKQCLKNYWEKRNAEQQAEWDLENAKWDKVAKKSQYIGKIGERIEVKIEGIKSIQIEDAGWNGQWMQDDKYINIIHTKDAEFIYIGSIDLKNQIVSKNQMEGQEVEHRIKCTVKDHKKREGINQTLVNRPMFV